MKARTLCLAALLLLFVVGQSPKPAHAAEDPLNWCGTPYPGWWHHITDPRSQLTVSVRNIVETDVDVKNGVATYKITLALTNAGKLDSPAGRLNLLLISLLTRNGHPGGVNFDADKVFNPNNQADAYAVYSRQAVGPLLLPAVQRGSTAFCDGSVRVALKTNVQELTGSIAR